MIPKEIVSVIASTMAAIIIIILHELHEGDWAFALAHVPPLFGLLYAGMSVMARQKAASKALGG
jgi:hypothetical protein